MEPEPNAEPRFDPAHMSLLGRIGSNRLWALHDPEVVSAPGRAAANTALNRRLLAEIDPNVQLPEHVREKRLQYARKAHFTRLVLKRWSAQRRRKAAGS